MHILRSIALWLVSVLFKTLLITTAIVSTIVMVFGSPAKIDKTLSASGVYKTIVSGVIKDAQVETQKQSQSGGEDTLPLDDPVIQQAVKDAFSPAVLQSAVENALDGTYHWLTGKTAKPDFAIDLTVPKHNLAVSIGDHAAAKLNALPVCTKQQLLQMNTDIDPFKAICKPPNLDVLAQKQKITEKIESGSDFLKNTVITADTLPKSQDGKTLFERFSIVPQAYKWISLSPLILGGILVLLAAAIIFLSRPRRRGFRSISFAMIGSGIFLTIAGVVAVWLVKRANGPGGALAKNTSTNNAQQSLSAVLSSFTSLINGELLRFGMGYIVIGSVILFVLFFTRSKTKPKETPEEHPGNSEKDSVNQKPENTGENTQKEIETTDKDVE